MNSTRHIENSLQAIISSLKKMESAAGVLSDLHKVSAELEDLDKLFHEGLKSVHYQFETFTRHTQLLSDYIDFQKKISQSRHADHSINLIFQFLEKKIAFDFGFMIYKLREDQEGYEILTHQSEHLDRFRKFVNESSFDNLKQKLVEVELGQLINDLPSFGFPEVKWSMLSANSVILFPLKVRGNLFGIGFLIRQKQLFEIQDLSIYQFSASADFTRHLSELLFCLVKIQVDSAVPIVESAG